MRKIAIFAICVILVTSGLFIFPIENVKASEILYVGGSGAGNYTTIQSAINNTNPGDTVFVYSGTYNENIIFYNKKNIKLIGEDRDTTIIDGGKNPYVIHMNYSFDPHPHILNENIYIKGCRIQNGTQAGVFNQYTKNVSIIDCTIMKCRYGIHFWHISYGTINKNVIINNERGIFLEFVDNLQIDKNFIHNNLYGIYRDTCNSITISYNDIRNCSEWGIYLFRIVSPGLKDNINHNNFVDNKYDASFEKNSIMDCRNIWAANYWDNSFSIRTGKHFIIGILELHRFSLILYWIQMDWCTANKEWEIKQ